VLKNALNHINNSASHCRTLLKFDRLQCIMGPEVRGMIKFHFRSNPGVGTADGDKNW